MMLAHTPFSSRTAAFCTVLMLLMTVGAAPATGAGDSALHRLAATVKESPTQTLNAVEYFHAPFGHYFVTAKPDEIAQLDAGVFAGWQRTGQTFNVYPINAVGTANVCRFFSTSFGPKSSHFYTPYATECAIVKQNPDWQFEAEVFAVGLPDAVGNCATDTQPLYRLYNDGQGGAPNHRYTTSTTTRQTMLSQGWVSEGYGPLGVTSCVPVAAACEVKDITRAPGGLVVWSPNGEQYIVNKKDAAGTYQLYVGNKGSSDITCITCTERPNSPAFNRHKLQPSWHPSGKWIVLAGERDDYVPPLFSTPELIEGWVQSGLWVNIYITRPDGSQWYRLSDFGEGRANGFTGVPFTPDGTKAVWAQIVDGNIFANVFGRWELILADFREDANGVPSFANLRNITPAGARWVEPGNFAPDGKSLLITADIGLTDAQGMDQFTLDITTGSVRNLTNSPTLWDEHGVFSPNGEKVFFMSSYPFRADPNVHSTLSLKTEFMLMNKDGSGLQQLTHFNTQGYPESNPWWRGSVAANGAWNPEGRSRVSSCSSRFAASRRRSPGSRSRT